MIGLRGAGFHAVCRPSYSRALLQRSNSTRSLLAAPENCSAFKPTVRTPVTIMDGRLFVKRNKEEWDWIILDAFRGGYAPPH